MAGITGVCSAKIVSSAQEVEQAAQATVYAAHTRVKLRCDRPDFILAQSSVEFLAEPWTYATHDQVSVWVDGEVYNREKFETEGVTFSEVVLAHYNRDDLGSLFAKVDGVFNVVLYDQVKQVLILVTDRYGIKPLYLYHKNNALIFAPELKCFPYIKPFDLKIRKDVVNSFIDLEHFMGITTWFEDVELVEPATLYTYSVPNHALNKKLYWSWSHIKPTQIPLPEAAERLGYLLEQAIRKRTFGHYRIGVALSGGFDSRAIVAAIREQQPTTYTFGIPDSADVRIARKVSRLAGVRNVHYNLHVDHWLQKRFEGVWKVDGMLNMFHMHYSHLMNEIPKIIDVNLSGFVGDGVLGQNYIVKKGKKFLDQRVTESVARHYYGDHSNFSNLHLPYLDIDKTDPYLFYNRGRRLTGLGLEEAAKTIPQRAPFMDTELLDFAYSMPDTYRENNRMYHRALMFRYPEFYRNLPHANTAQAINLNPGVWFNFQKKVHWVRHGIKYRLGLATNYSDVSNWIKEPETVMFVRNLLNPEHALYVNFTDQDFNKLYLEPHINGTLKKIKPLMGAITMEVWLQQIINKKYLPAVSY